MRAKNNSQFGYVLPSVNSLGTHRQFLVTSKPGSTKPNWDKNDNIVQSIIVTNNGEAAILDANGAPMNRSTGFLNDNRIVVPNKHVDISRIRGIFANSGIIRFEENKAFLNFVIQENRELTIMQRLGKIAEAVIVNRCSESEEINYRFFCIATGKRAHKETARQFKAIGTGLLDTRIGHSRHYNPADTQRDIIFVDKNNIPALMSHVTSLAGECAGLQVKTSTDIINYILHDIVTVRYCVPIICLPVMDFSEVYFSLINRDDIFIVDIYSELISRIMQSKYYLNTLIKNNPEFFDNHRGTKKLEDRLYDYLKSKVYDIRDIDKGISDEILFIKDLLKDFINGKISPDDLMHESETLKSHFMSMGLYLAPYIYVENNNMLVSGL